MNALIAICVLTFATLINARVHHEHRGRKSMDNLMEPDELFAIGMKQALRTVHSAQKISDSNDGFGVKMANRALDSEKRGARKNILLNQMKRVNKISRDNDLRRFGSGATAGKLSKEVDLKSDRGSNKKLDVQKTGKVEGVKSVRINGSKVASGTFSATWKSQMVKSINWGNQNLTEIDRINKEGKIVGVLGSDGRRTINVVKVIKADGNQKIQGSKGVGNKLDINKTVNAERSNN